jgi:ubiquinone biosynthesis protein Coq4
MINSWTMKLWSKIRLLFLFIRLIFRPQRTDLIIRVIEIVSENPDLKPVKMVEETIMSVDSFKTMFEEKYNPDRPSMAMLQNCPPGSFGKSVFDHMTTHQITFDLFPTYGAEKPIMYLSTRIYQDHDLWHTLFGFATEVEDELALQAFSLAQFKSPAALALIAGGMVHLLIKNPIRAVEAFKKVTGMYNIGNQIPFLLGVRLHELFTRPLEEVRQICKIA